MILIFDYFNTIVQNRSMDFNRGLKKFWEDHYSDKCSFEGIKAYGEELFEHLMECHQQGKEFAFVKEELPLYAEKFGGETVLMDTEEETEFLMLCNDMEPVPGMEQMLMRFWQKGIPMYVLSNSGFTAGALWRALDHMGIGEYFQNVWSSADYGEIKPCKGFFDQAIERALRDHPEENKEDILFIGDTYETDVIGAHNAGIKSVWINRDGRSDDMGYASYVIRETAELVQCVENE